MADIAASTSTTGSISVGGLVQGSLEVAGDHDWYRVTLTAGQSITISLSGSGTNPVADTYLNLRNASGSIIATNDDTGGGYNSKIVFTPTTSGTYYIDAGAWDTLSAPPAPNNQYTGGYTLSVQPWTPPPVATYNQIADQLINGYWNSIGETAHHFNVSQGGTITVNLTALTPAGQSLAQAALAEWTDIIGVNFAQVSTGGQIVFDDNQTGAFTDDQYSGHVTTSAHVNVSTQWLTDYGTGIDSYSFQTYIHEIGHALGLGHAGDYNGDADFAADALFLNDAWSTLIMSYFSPHDNSSFAGQGFSDDFALTPMMADIVAMQQMYGLSTTTRTGNTTYGLNSNAGNVYNPTIVPNAAYTIFDSAGVDTIDYSNSPANQLINLNAETFSNVNGQTGNVAIARGVVIENAVGGSGNDTLIGNSVANILTGNGGNDTLDGGAGADTLIGGLGDDTYVVDNVGDVITEAAGGGIDTVQSSASYVLGDNLENLTLTGSSAVNGTGNALSNVITGNTAANMLDGGTGADRLIGGAGDDTFYVDNGGDQVVENAGEGTDLVNASISYVLGANVENLTLTGAGAINGTGNTLDNVIRGTDANNVLDGGAGADKLYGGGGDDTYIVDNANDAIAEAGGGGTDLVQASVSYTLAANVENLTLTGTGAINGTGNTLNNVIRGNDANNVLDGGVGADKLYGGLGDDTYVVDNARDGISEAVGAGIDTANASVSYTLAANVENLTLTGTAAINGTGNSLDNVLRGNDAANTLNGGVGADKMYGGAGDDVYIVDNAGDGIAEAAGQGLDTVKASVSYALAANVENLTLLGSAAINATGNALNNALRGNGAANILDGGAGADKMYGGAGDDTYIVDNAGDGIAEAAGQGTDLVQSSISFTLGANVENLTLTGSAAINATGNTLGNVLTGNSAVNILDGGAGTDHLIGGDGNDAFLFDDGDFGGMTADTADEITDFTTGDKLDLHLVDANSLVSGDQGFAFIGTDAFHNVAGELRYEESGGNTFVYGDTNGDGIADFMIKVDGSHHFVTNDFGL